MSKCFKTIFVFNSLTCKERLDSSKKFSTVGNRVVFKNYFKK